MFAAVLEDAVDQLAILGAIVPDYTSKPSAAEAIMGNELTQILAEQKQLESKFNEVSSWVGLPGQGNEILCVNS